MTSHPDIQLRIQSLLDEMLDLLDEYEQATKVDAVLSVKREFRLRIKKIQSEIKELTNMPNGRIFPKLH